MSDQVVAGVDWAGDGWLAILFAGDEFHDCQFKPEFAALLERLDEADPILVDIPIGLPVNQETQDRREALDSLARSVTGRPSSVFPVPSRDTVTLAYEGCDYEAVVGQNEDDLNKGLSWQSFHIASAIGEVDCVLRESEETRERVVESHPELCFRAMLDRPLVHSKNTAIGVGERLDAIENHVGGDSAVILANAIRNLDEDSRSATVDDVLDALVLAITASEGSDGLRYLEPAGHDAEASPPMRMAYSADEQLGDGD